jgi:hypothetical protein
MDGEKERRAEALEGVAWGRQGIIPEGSCAWPRKGGGAERKGVISSSKSFGAASWALTEPE